MTSSVKRGRAPGEAFADVLEHMAAHARKYRLTGMSFHFDNGEYRVTVEGDGTLILPGQELESGDQSKK